MGKIMVTGALGNVGGYVAKYLIQNQQEVVAADISREALELRYGAGQNVSCLILPMPKHFLLHWRALTGCLSCVPLI